LRWKVDPIDEVLPLPPEVTYQETKQRVVRERRNVENLAAYTKRENRIAMVGRMLDEDRDRDRERQAREVEVGQAEEVEGVVPEKRMKFDLITFL
jgi:hypothetical protein